MPAEELLPAPLVTVAITGKLSMPREEVAKLINATQNAQFVSSVTYHTSFLVAALSSSQKVAKARKIGVEILTENQMFGYLQPGRFPLAATHHYERPAPPPFEVEWLVKYPESRSVSLKYRDASGHFSERDIELLALGKSLGGIWYLSSFDCEGPKTFRCDRIEEMTDVATKSPINVKALYDPGAAQCVGGGALESPQ